MLPWNDSRQSIRIESRCLGKPESFLPATTINEQYPLGTRTRPPMTATCPKLSLLLLLINSNSIIISNNNICIVVIISTTSNIIINNNINNTAGPIQMQAICHLQWHRNTNRQSRIIILTKPKERSILTNNNNQTTIPQHPPPMLLRLNRRTLLVSNPCRMGILQTLTLARRTLTPTQQVTRRCSLLFHRPEVTLLLLPRLDTTHPTQQHPMLPFTCPLHHLLKRRIPQAHSLIPPPSTMARLTTANMARPYPHNTRLLLQPNTQSPLLLQQHQYQLSPRHNNHNTNHNRTHPIRRLNQRQPPPLLSLLRNHQLLTRCPPKLRFTIYLQRQLPKMLCSFYQSWPSRLGVARWTMTARTFALHMST